MTSPFALDKLPGFESAAAIILNQAVSADSNRRFLEALTCYKEGIELLMSVIKGCHDDLKKEKLRTRVEEYIGRAEKLKILIDREKQSGSFHEQVRITDNSTGHSYDKLFKALIDEEVTQVDIEDPFIRSHHQLLNFVRFCEMLSKNACNLKSLHLLTGQDVNNVQEQQSQRKAFDELTRSLAMRGVKLETTISATLHDREIRLNNGWVVKIGRGLDYFKPISKFSIGSCDFDLRPCHETVVDIYHRKHK